MCLICDRIHQIRQGTNPYFVKELETGYVVIGDHQHFYGYTLFLCKKHVVELSGLDRDDRNRYLEEMADVTAAVQRAFPCEKMNCELLGNGETHLHWHLFPRRAGDIGTYGNHGKGPVWWLPMDQMYDDSNRPDEPTLIELKARLLYEL